MKSQRTTTRLHAKTPNLSRIQPQKIASPASDMKSQRTTTRLHAKTPNLSRIQPQKSRLHSSLRKRTDFFSKLNRPAQALIAYQQTLATEPNRLRSVYGAAKAAASTGDSATARAYYEQLVFLEGHADSETPEVAEAKAYLGQP